MRWPLRTYLFRGGTWLALVIGASFASLSLLVFNDGDSSAPSGIAFAPGTGAATSPAPGAEDASNGGGLTAATPSAPAGSVATLAQVTPPGVGTPDPGTPPPSGAPTPGGGNDGNDGSAEGGNGGPVGSPGQSPPDNPTPRDPTAPKPPTPAPPTTPPRDDDDDDGKGEPCRPDHDDHDWDDDDHDWDDSDDDWDHGDKGGNGNHYGWENGKHDD